MIDIIILNRNLKQVTEKLRQNLIHLKGVNQVLVVDSGSRDDEVAEGTFVRANDSEAKLNGLRPNRGFNLGLQTWFKLNEHAHWVLLLPNDSEIHQFDFDKLDNVIGSLDNIVAVYPLAPNSIFRDFLDESRCALGWSMFEGPLMIGSSYIVERLNNESPLFDPDNYRGYLSFTEFALQAYMHNKGIVFTDLISFEENESHLIHHSQLIQTEPLDINQKLFLAEGESWMSKKYGASDKYAIERLTRLAFEEFLECNPGINLQII